MIDVNLLTGHPFTAGLPDAHLRGLAGCARLATIPPGGQIFHEGEPADALFLVRSGRIALVQHVAGRGEVVFEDLHGGDILGLSWMIPGSPWVLSARAVEATELVAIESGCLRALMASDVELGFALATRLLRQLYERLERVRLQRLDVYQEEGSAGR